MESEVTSADLPPRRVAFPREGEFLMPAEYWIEAGMEEFERRSDEVSYSPTPSPELLVVRVEDVAPPNMDKRQHKGPGGFCPKRMIDVLRKIASRNPMHPVEVVERQQGDYRYHLHHGYHRFHASVAAGFSHVPVIVVSGWTPETPAINALP
jgi:hypothetical protein